MKKRNLFFCIFVYFTLFAILGCILKFSFYKTLGYAISIGLIALGFFSLSVDIYSIYCTQKGFKLLKKDFYMLVKIHRTKYKYYFIDDKDSLSKLTKMFDQGSSYFIKKLTTKEHLDLMNFSPKQLDYIQKMRKKVKEMCENAFVANYNI